jgi:hypothetical protein
MPHAPSLLAIHPQFDGIDDLCKMCFETVTSRLRYGLWCKFENKVMKFQIPRKEILDQQVMFYKLLGAMQSGTDQHV